MSNDDVIDTLNDLIETSKDGEYGFRACAEQAESPTLKANFAQRADECGRAAAELQAAVRNLGGEAEERGSAAGSMHRGWVAIKTKLTSYDDLAVLEEVERGEDSALAAYRDALKADLPASVRSLVEQQYNGAKRNHDQMRTLRDEHRAAKASA
jgi:uncharacterized protein (TIGR02284 family)